MLRWLGLRSRLVLLVLMALLPVFGLFTYSAEKNQQALVALAQASLQSDALLAAAHQQRLVDRIAQLLHDIASGPSIKDKRTPLCTEYLKNLQSQDAGYDNLGVVSLDGKIVCRALGAGINGDASDRPYFRQVMATQKFSVGEYGIGRISGRPGIAFGAPVYSNEGFFNGVAFAALEIDTVQKALEAGRVLDGAQLRVIDRNGIVLASHPVVESLQGRQEHDLFVLDAARSGQPGVREAVDAGGIERVYAYAPVGGAANGGLFVAISVPRDVITAASRDLQLMDIASLLAVAVFGMACAWVMGKRLVVNPVDAILKEANEIALGNLHPRVKLGRWHQDEVGRLGLAFNRMADSLQAQRGELDAALRHADGERGMLDLILNSMSEGVIAVDTDGRFILFNAAARALFPGPAAGESFEAWRQNNSLMLLDGKFRTDNGPLSQALRGASVDNLDFLHCTPGAPDRMLRMSARPLRGLHGLQIGALTVFSDVTALKVAESFALAQEDVLVLIAGGAPLRASLEAIVRLIEKSAPQCWCSVLMVEGAALRHGLAPSLPQDFVEAIDTLPIAEGAGACGTAAFRKEIVIVEDTAQDPLTRDFRELLALHGLRACWSAPVMDTDGAVLAIFAIYLRRIGGPQPADLALMARAVRLAGLALARARAEAALLESDARFRELAENIEDVFYTMDVHQGGVRYISPGYEKVWGRSCQSLYAAPFSYLDAVVPEDRPVLRQVGERSRAGQKSDVEYRIRSASGQIRWIRDRSYPVFNAAGAIERTVGTARDITDSKLAKMALIASHRALQMISNSSLAINRIHDEASLLAEVCRVAVEVGGYRMAWVGYANDDEEKSIEPVAHAGHELGFLQEIKLCWRDDVLEGQGPAGRAIRTGQPQQTGNIRQSASHFHSSEAAAQRGYLSALALPLCSEKNPFGILCLYAGEVQHFAPEEVRLLQELADNLAFGIFVLRARLVQRRSDEAARAAAAQLHEQASLIDLAPNAIVVRNLDRTLRFWNQGAERLYGWRAHEVLGKTMEALMYPDPQVFVAAFESILNARGDWIAELEQKTRDGSALCVEARSTVLRDAHGQASGVMVVITDIHERKQAREEILQLNASLEERVERRTAQLKFANQQLEAFSYSASHDLRTPLSSINGFSALLEKSLTGAGAPPLPERSQHYLARIRSGVGQMGELIDAMLSLAQVSRSSLVWERVDLSALAEALLLGLREREPGRKVRLQVAPGLLAQGDPRLLRQVLDNFLGNAWKFSAKGAQTCITVGQTTTGEGEQAYFVRDNGAGFDMAYVEKLFGAFQRLHTEAEFAGTGIGLATVQRIVARHGGRVWAESVQGEGASFYFTLGAAPV